jgi:hypothetical protein
MVPRSTVITAFIRFASDVVCISPKNTAMSKHHAGCSADSNPQLVFRPVAYREPPHHRGIMARVPRSLLLAAAALLAAAPLMMPDSYSWVEHTTSESAAQGVPGAWVARAGFVAFGVGVAAITWRSRRVWNPLTVIAHAGFAVCMVGAAVFSTRSWLDVPFDETQDALHSLAASTIGFSFVLGVVSSLFDRAGSRRSIRVVDVLAVAASVAIPMAMFNLDGVAGVMQRVMFAVALWWYIDVRPWPAPDSVMSADAERPQRTRTPRQHGTLPPLG